MTTFVTSSTLDSTFNATLATLTASQALSNKTLKTTKEAVTITNTAATGILNFDVATQAISVYNTATANFSVNLRGSSTVPLSSVLATGESIGICMIVPKSTVGYYLTSISIDGVAQTIKYQGGAAFTVGNPSSTDMYNIFVIRTGTTTYLVYLSQTKYSA